MKIKNVRAKFDGDKIVIVKDGWSDEQLGENLNWMPMNSDSQTILTSELIDPDPVFEISDEQLFTEIEGFAVDYDVIDGYNTSNVNDVPTYHVEDMNLYTLIVEAKNELEYIEILPFVNHTLTGHAATLGKGLEYFQYSELRDNVFKVRKFDAVLHLMLKWYMNEIVIEPVQSIEHAQSTVTRYYLQTTDVDEDGDRQYVQLNVEYQTEFNVEYGFNSKTLFNTYDEAAEYLVPGLEIVEIQIDAES